MEEKSIYDFSMESLEGQIVPLSNFMGKVILVVNVASFWGSTIEEVMTAELSHSYSLTIFCVLIMYPT